MIGRAVAGVLVRYVLFLLGFTFQRLQIGRGGRTSFHQVIWCKKQMMMYKKQHLAKYSQKANVAT